MPTYSLSVSCPYCHRVTACVRVNGSPQTWVCSCGATQTLAITVQTPGPAERPKAG
jgi:hypothetical protein